MFGIPTLLKKAPKAAAISLIGSAVGKLTDFLFGGPKWNIYKTGTSTLAVKVSSIVELDVAGESSASDYPIETGSFVSYNKVLSPNTFIVRVTQDGKESDRSTLVKWLELNVGTTDTFDIICPEHTWLNSTLVRYRTVRTAESGPSMLTVDCYFQQVRELPAKYSQSKVAAPGSKLTLPTVQVIPIPDVKLPTFPLPDLPSLPKLPTLPSLPPLP